MSFRTVVILGFILTLVGCAGSGARHSPKLTDAQLAKMLEASSWRAAQMKEYPADADMENFDQQVRLMQGGMYLTWTGEYKQLPSTFQVNPTPVERPNARYVKDAPGRYDSLKGSAPVDIMR